jgi:hypothetical protein
MQGPNGREIWQDADNHWRGSAQAGGVCLQSEVDTDREDVVVVENDIAEIDANAESMRRSGCTPVLRAAISRCTSTARRTASTTLANSPSRPSPVVLTMRPQCSLTWGRQPLAAASSAQRACLPRPPPSGANSPRRQLPKSLSGAARPVPLP